MKKDYVAAIMSARHPAVVAEVIASRHEEEAKGEAKEEAKEVVDKAEEEMAKKMISAKYNKKEMIAIVAKEKIVMKPGRKVKDDYVTAIYMARK